METESQRPAGENSAPICPVPPESAPDAFAAIISAVAVGHGAALAPRPNSTNFDPASIGLLDTAQSTRLHAVLDKNNLGNTSHFRLTSVAPESKPESPASVRRLPVSIPPVPPPLISQVTPLTSPTADGFATEKEHLVLTMLRIIDRTGGSVMLSPVERALLAGAKVMFEQLAVECVLAPDRLISEPTVASRHLHPVSDSETAEEHEPKSAKSTTPPKKHRPSTKTVRSKAQVVEPSVSDQTEVDPRSKAQ